MSLTLNNWAQDRLCLSIYSTLFIVSVSRQGMRSLQKHAYSNIKKIPPPKTVNFQIKNSDIFLISTQNRLWVLNEAVLTSTINLGF